MTELLLDPGHQTASKATSADAPHDPGATAAAQQPLLEVRNLAVEFGVGRAALRAVDGVSFSVSRGETLAIVGESGSGKSVTALSLLRLIPSPPSRVKSGEILFEGRDLLGLSTEEIRAIRGNEIAMIFQEPMSSLNPSLTVGLQVAEPLQLHHGMSWRKALDKAKDLLSRVRIPNAESRVNAYPHEFSGGMRQRAMIAMALACNPKLIIADEPTTALDVTVQAQILSLLKDLTRETNAALILITHDLGVVARYADRVCVMYAGRVVESGTAHEIYERPSHPYTLGLMASIPRLDQDAQQRLIPIEGQPPDLSALPKGCAFQARCRYVGNRCREQRPPLEQIDGRHFKACFADVPHGVGPDDSRI
ncbi:ABC transporter ATP-binding protein [Tardiphaga sp.]|uniref:ABC transporter ATP-binding protein n=1 Tax=Tardiphaga sp. TaxID=1926292 RepID=UPI0025E12740|nr:ABC transporter ATP-binding protein [Tardiphaga sp.]